MSGHTPGPWKLLANQGVVGADWLPIATAPGHPAADFRRPPDERIANARLIAAAPDLYEALQKIDTIEGCTGGAEVLISEFKHIARTALAKAEGSTT